MPAAKQLVVDLLARSPGDCSFSEIGSAVSRLIPQDENEARTCSLCWYGEDEEESQPAEVAEPITPEASGESLVDFFRLPPKEQVLRMVQRCRDDDPLSHLDYHIFFLKKMCSARQSVERGDVYTNEEVKEYLNRKWGLELK